MRRVFRILIVLVLVGAAAGWFLSAPHPLPATAMDELTGDAARGETVFWAGGCAACHAAPGADGDARLVLAGGYRIASPFGTFVAPNISPGPQGLAGWSALDLANALKRGVSPEGAHLYPSLPYTTYARMTLQDVADLKAFLDTLPVSDTPSLPHELGFPFTVRRGLGLWKLLFLDDGSSAQSLTASYAKAFAAPHAFADVILDQEVSKAAVLKKLDELERIAFRKGSAIGVASAFDESVDAVTQWVREAQGRGIEVVGVSVLADVPD